MHIAILLTSTGDAVELIFREKVVVGHLGDLLIFWSEQAYLDRSRYGSIRGGALAARIFDVPSEETFGATAEKIIGSYGIVESGSWQELPATWVHFSDGLGLCLTLLIQLSEQFALQLEYSTYGMEATWLPFSEGLLASIERVSLVRTSP